MRPRRGWPVAVVVGLLLVVSLATVLPVTARPPPQPLCEVCSDDVLDGSDVASSSVTVEIDDRGVGHWTVRLELRANSSVDSSAVRSAAEDALRGHRGEATPRNLSVRVTADTAVLTYDVPRMGHRSAGGVLVVDYFHAQGDQGRWYGVNADRVVITGPAGTTLLRAPEEYRLNGTTLALEGTYGDVFDRTISPGWYLAFAEDDGIVADGASHVGIWIDVAGANSGELPGTVVLPTAVLAAFLGVCSRYGATLAERSPGGRLLEVTVLTAVFAGVCLAVVILISALPMAVTPLAAAIPVFDPFGLLLAGGMVGPLIALSTAAVAIQYALLSRQFGVGVEARWHRRYGIAIAVLTLVVGLFAAGMPGPTATLYGSTVAVLVPTLFVPLALSDGRLAYWLLTATVLSSPLLVSLGWAPYGSYGTMYASLFTVGWALLAGAIGTLAYTVGRSEPRVGGPAQ